MCSKQMQLNSESISHGVAFHCISPERDRSNFLQCEILFLEMWLGILMISLEKAQKRLSNEILIVFGVIDLIFSGQSSHIVLALMLS